ncbi:MAG: hypothetical protein LIO62_07765, partial [Clostridiales bacterium]|nr:hypothetical protein [Clostridiales bacterium]
MNIIDYRFSKETNALIKNLIGKTLEVVAFDSLPNAATTAYGMVSIVVDGCRYCFSDFLESIEYINRTEDVAIFKFEKISDSDFASFLEERIPIVNT